MRCWLRCAEPQKGDFDRESGLKYGGGMLSVEERKVFSGGR